MSSRISLSVVVSAHAGTNFDYLRQAVASVLSQSYDSLELVVVLSDAPSVAETLREEFTDEPRLRIVEEETDTGLSAARNYGASVANGDVLAFVDDDVVLREGWAAALTRPYAEHDVVGAGGPAYPVWRTDDGEPKYLPPEFYWLVGCTERGFEARVWTDDGGVRRTRNTYGCNISFRADVFETLGGFDQTLGKQHGLQQAEETEFCERLRARYGEELAYVPDAVVDHMVDQSQVELAYLLERAWWQGRSKAKLERLVDVDTGGQNDALDAEGEFLKRLVPATGRGLAAFLRNPSAETLSRPVMLWALTLSTVGGYARERLAGSVGGS